MIIILYILKSEKYEFFSHKSNNFQIDICTINNLYDLRVLKRYHTIYIDKEFNTNHYQLLFDQVYRPMASLRNGQGLIFI